MKEVEEMLAKIEALRDELNNLTSRLDNLTCTDVVRISVLLDSALNEYHNRLTKNITLSKDVSLQNNNKENVDYEVVHELED